jgi:hypothetical protein
MIRKGQTFTAHVLGMITVSCPVHAALCLHKRPAGIVPFFTADPRPALDDARLLCARRKTSAGCRVFFTNFVEKIVSKDLD